jgi:hypothetical protein
MYLLSSASESTWELVIRHQIPQLEATSRFPPPQEPALNLGNPQITLVRSRGTASTQSFLIPEKTIRKGPRFKMLALQLSCSSPLKKFDGVGVTH